MQDPNDQAAASTPTTKETVINGPNRSGIVRRKAAKRTESWCLAPPPPQDQDTNDVIDLCSDSDDEKPKPKEDLSPIDAIVDTITYLLGKKRTYIAMAPAETAAKAAHEEERRMRIIRSLGDHSKYDSPGGGRGGSVIPPSLGHAATAGVAFGGSSLRNTFPGDGTSFSNWQGLGHGSLTSGLQNRGVDYASLIQQRLLEEQAQRDFMSQTAMLGG
jgi:hypothetical protein